MRFPKILYWLGFLWLLAPATTLAETVQVLRFFQDGCAAASSASAFCKLGDRAGFRCTPQPEFDPDNPNFSSDCCTDLNNCFTNDPVNECAVTRLRCSEGRFGEPCESDADCGTLICTAGQPDLLGEECDGDADCSDTFVCVAGDPFFIGDECFDNSDCEDLPGPAGVCASTGTCEPGRDGECDVADDSVLGHVLTVNGETALLAVVSSVGFVPKPSNNKKDRLDVEFEYQLFDRRDIVEIDPAYCVLPLRIRAPITPTAGMLQNGLNGTGETP
jgi:hypothetical protein